MWVDKVGLQVMKRSNDLLYERWCVIYCCSPCKVLPNQGFLTKNAWPARILQEIAWLLRSCKDYKDLHETSKAHTWPKNRILSIILRKNSGLYGFSVKKAAYIGISWQKNSVLGYFSAYDTEFFILMFFEQVKSAAHHALSAVGFVNIFLRNLLKTKILFWKWKFNDTSLFMEPPQRIAKQGNLYHSFNYRYSFLFSTQQNQLLFVCSDSIETTSIKFTKTRDLSFYFLQKYFCLSLHSNQSIFTASAGVELWVKLWNRPFGKWTFWKEETFEAIKIL